MTEFVSALLQWLNNHPHLAGLVTFIISAGESVAIIGTIVPGSITMTAIGTLAGAGIVPLWSTIGWAILGAIVGDGISYWLGYYFKDRIKTFWPFRNYPSILGSGEKFFHRYGFMSVFIGRFVGPVRALVPLVAGMLGMKPWHFIFANVTSAIGWAPAYMLPGIMLGAASLELPPDIAMHIILTLLLISLFVLMCLWFVYKLLKLIANQITRVLNHIWQFMRASRYFSPITFLLKHHNKDVPHGQLNLALYFIFTAALFLVLGYYVQHTGAINILANDAAYHLFRGLRTPHLDTIMIDITLLGQKEVILPVVVIFTAWLMICRRFRCAFHVLALGVLAAGGVFFFKHFFKIERPWGIFNSPETFSFPSGHTTLATVAYVGLAFLIALNFEREKRKPIYLLGIFIAFMVGVSRLYLSAHWFTDVVGAWLLGMAVLMFVMISYQRKEEASIPPFSSFLVCLLSLAVTFTFYHHQHIEQLKINYAQINLPVEKIELTSWWQKDGSLPAYNTSLFGFKSQPLSVQWVGNLDKIRTSLMKEGWNKPPARDLISTLHRIADISSTQYLPLVSPQYLDQKPDLILTRNMNNKDNGLLVIRLWNANRTLRINKKEEQLWVGTVAIVPRAYDWLFRRYPGDITIEPFLVFPNKKELKIWHTRLITLDGQRIMLIKQKK